MVKTGDVRAPRDCGLPETPYFLTPDFAERHGVDLGGAIHGGILTIEQSQGFRGRPAILPGMPGWIGAPARTPRRQRSRARLVREPGHS